MKKSLASLLAIILFLSTIPVQSISVAQAAETIDIPKAKPIPSITNHGDSWDGIVGSNVKVPQEKKFETGQHNIDERPPLTEQEKQELAKDQVTFEQAFNNANKKPLLLQALAAEIIPDGIVEKINNINIKSDQSPYNIDMSGEKISTLDGSATIERSDLTLPGRGGMGFTLTRTYNSAEAQLSAMDIDPYSGANKVDTPYYNKIFPIGIGWRFNVASIETKKIGTLEKKYLHTASGGVYEIDANLQLIGYPWKDLVLTKDTSVTSNGKTSAYSLTNVVSGVKQYFSANGQLIEMRDLHGDKNKIQFKYLYQAEYGEVLTNIMDSAGNVITITYSSTKVTLELNYGVKTITLLKSNKANYENNNKIVEYMYQETDPEGRITTYDSLTRGASFNLNGTTPSKLNSYYLITAINHPSQARTVLQYENNPVKRFIADNAVNEVYRFDQRWDGPIKPDPSDATMINLRQFAYVGDMAVAYDKNATFQTKVTEQIANDKITTVYDMDREYIKVDPKIDTPVRYYTKKVTKNLLNAEKDITEFTPLIEKRIDIPKSIVSYTEKSGSKSDENRQATFYNDYGQVDTHYQRVNADTTTAKAVYTYDDQHNLKSKSEDLNRDGKKRVTEYTYTAQKDVMGITVSEQNTQGTTMLSEVAFISDEYGNPTRKTTTSDGGKIFEDYEYDATYHALMTKQTNDMMDPTFKSEKVYRYMDYDRSTGLLNWVKDGNGQTTNYTYDKLGRLTKVTNPDKSTSTAAYDDVNNKIIYTDETNVQTTHTFNVYGWKRQVYGDNNNGKMDYIYDNSGRVVREEDAVGNLTHHFYDESNRLVQTTYPTQDNMIIAYNSIANTRTIRATDSRLFKETYGLQGEVLRSQEFWGNSGEKQKLPTKYIYDFEGRMLESREHYAFVEESYNKTTQEYDALGRLTAITTPNNEKTAYKYTKTNLLKQVTYPDGNFIEKVYDQSGNLLIEKDENKNQTLHAYDNEGNEKTLTDRKGNTFTYEYDSRNRLKKKTATNREIGLYDPEITFDYDLAGRMITMNDYTGTTKYQYDYAAGGSQAKLGLLKSISYPDDKQLSYEYDKAGQVTRMTDPFGKVTNYEYQAGRLDKVGQDLTKPDASYTYKAGNLDRIDLNTGKIVTNHVYTEGMLSDVTHKTDVGQSLGSYGYEYDDYANITKLKEDNQVTSSLTYDPLHRVQTNSMFKEAYQYNNRGNRETLQSDQLPQVPLNQYKYDSRDQLIEVKAPAKNNGEAKQVAYVYNGQGLMVKRTESNQVDEGDKRVSRYYYDADANIIAEEKTEGDTTSQYSYIRSGGQLVAKVDQAGIKQYYLHNGHGDVVSITDDQGNKLAEYKYDIWGKILPVDGNNLTNKVDNIFFYSGEYYDETTELQYLRARWYDPSVGRFIQEDTYEGQNDNPQSLNLYTYVENNPLSYTDPTGYNPAVIFSLARLTAAAVETALIATTVYIEEKYFNKPVVQQPWVEQKPTVSIREWQSKNPTVLKTPYIQQKLTVTQQGEKINTSGVLTSGAKSKGNAVPTKPGGGSNPNDFVNPHSEKHMFDPSRTSTPNRSQYGKDVDVGKLRQETMTNPDKAYSNWPNPNNPNTQRITKYNKEFDGNISTPNTPTGSHRVFENLNDPTRSSHFPYVPRK